VKIKRLTLAGFGPYKTEQHVDFEAFEDAGIFLITGKTGAGKSSILDAICYALYASVPRYDNTQAQLRSDHSASDDPSFVELEFTVGDTDYRVRREPEYERPKLRGTGTTKKPATAQLDQRTGDRWEGIASRAVDVGNELDRIVGLSKDQFLQVILLAQNRFQKFLQAGNDDRQTVLRSLFGTRRFAVVEATLVERRKALESRLVASRSAFAQQASVAAGLLGLTAPPEDADLAWLVAASSDLEQQLAAAVETARDADAAAGEADNALRALEALGELQRRRDAAAARRTQLDVEQPAVDADRATLASAHRSATVWGQLVARREAAAAVEAAVDAEQRARGLAGVSADTGRAEISAAVQLLTRQLGTLDDVVQSEARLPELQAARAALEEQRSHFTARIADAVERMALLPEAIDRVAEELTAAEVEAAAEPAEVDRLARTTTAHNAALDLARQEIELVGVLAREGVALAALQDAIRHTGRLLQARLSGNAADLASKLIPGEPCAVCGALDHPQPAVWDGTPVRDEDIETSREIALVRQADVDAAATKSRSLLATVEGSRALSGDRSVDELAAEVEEVRAALASARQAKKEAVTHRASHARLRAELAGATTALDALQTDADAVVARLAGVEGECASITSRVAAQRGDHESVRARAADMAHRIQSLAALADAVAAQAATQDRLATTTRALENQLAEEGFATEEQAAAARQSKLIVAALEARITHHDQALAAVTSTLAEPELADLPSDLVSTDSARATADEARTLRDAARDRRHGLGVRFTEIDRIVQEARRRTEATATLEEEFALLRALAAAVEGNAPNTKRMKLETYVLAAQLEEIVKAANVRLRTMTSGRFELEHNDAVQFRNTRSGLGLNILDQHTGRSRATHSLSGGETFLASLALALGLAEVVTNQAGGITLDTLFIDEGFGSLDAETLDIAMATLDSLRAGGRTIGLISHVETMKEQITAKLRVTVSQEGHSEIMAIVDAG